jgi:hypothetical protein
MRCVVCVCVGLFWITAAGGPYRQDLMYARVPAEYVGGGDVR